MRQFNYLIFFTSFTSLVLAADLPQCPDKQCLSKWGNCGTSISHCGPGCQAGSCWSGRNTPDNPPFIQTLQVETMNGKNYCTVTEDFTSSNLSKYFKISYCPSHFRSGNGTASLKLDKECGTNIATSKSYSELKIEARMKTVKEPGVITAFILRSDQKEPADEIDLEWVGTDSTSVQSNYFIDSKVVEGRMQLHRYAWDSEKEFHNYGIEWNPQVIRWLIDGRVVRTLNNPGTPGEFPLKPMHMEMATWGHPGPFWSGGPVNFNNGPFFADFEWVKIRFPC